MSMIISFWLCGDRVKAVAGGVVIRAFGMYLRRVCAGIVMPVSVLLQFRRRRRLPLCSLVAVAANVVVAPVAVAVATL